MTAAIETFDFMKFSGDLNREASKAKASSRKWRLGAFLAFTVASGIGATVYASPKVEENKVTPVALVLAIVAVGLTERQAEKRNCQASEFRNIAREAERRDLTARYSAEGYGAYAGMTGLEF